MFRRNFTLAITAIITLSFISIALVYLGLTVVLTIALPYIAFVLFLFGFVYRIVQWAKAPVPFRIPTTCGQEKSLPWIQNNPVENPAGPPGVIGRMAGEIFLFRSLFRNSQTEIVDGRPIYGSAKWLWLFGLMFHLSLLAVALRHLRFFTEPVVPLATGLSALDGFLEIGVPALYISDVTLLAGWFSLSAQSHPAGSVTSPCSPIISRCFDCGHRGNRSFDAPLLPG